VPAGAARPALLAALPVDEYRRLAPHLSRVHLALKQVLYEPGAPVTHVYFPLDAVVSLLTVMGDGSAIETGLVGREGLAGLPVFFRTGVGDGRAVCQVAGDAWRLPADAFRAALDRGGDLPVRLLRYAQTVLRTAAQAVACNALHSVEARCARWLLMVADRVGGDRFPMTQLFLAEMLGVRRASVVDVIGILTGGGLIAHGYGQVTVLDRQGLEAAACECYQVLKAQFKDAAGEA
jgi:CRP-like cAMP-binding protein